MSSQGVDPLDLFRGAQQKGLISQKSAQTLIVPNLGAKFRAGLGIPADAVQASRVFLETKLWDDSTSIPNAGNIDAMIEGSNIFDDALIEGTDADNVLMSMHYLNGRILYPYLPLSQSARLDKSNYRPSGYTPLYDRTIEILGTVLAKYLEFSNIGVAVQTHTVLMTDGYDEGSRKVADDVKSIVSDLLMHEDHIIMAIGVNLGQHDFRRTFMAMGIQEQNILDTNNLGEPDIKAAIRRACRMASRSALHASKSALAFSKSAIGGFGKP